MGSCFIIPQLNFNTKLFYKLIVSLRLLTLDTSLITLILTIEHQILPTISEQCYFMTIILTPILQLIWTIIIIIATSSSRKKITIKSVDIVFHISIGIFLIITSILYLYHSIGFNLYCNQFMKEYPIPKYISNNMNHKKYFEYVPECLGFGDVHGMNSLRILSGVLCLVNGMISITIGLLIRRSTDMFLYRRYDNQIEGNTTVLGGTGQDDTTFVGGNGNFGPAQSPQLGFGRLPQFVIDNEREYLDLTGNNMANI